jgi:uncharacterized protein YecE (DUF72 family)
LHGGSAAPPGCYDRKTLAGWANRLVDLWKKSEEVYAFFNNDVGGHAVVNARMLRALAHASS